MRLDSYSILDKTGDIKAFYCREAPTPDGHEWHEVLLEAGNYDALESGFRYTNDAFRAEVQTYQHMHFPEEIKAIARIIWETPKVLESIQARKEIVRQRLEEIQAAEEAAIAARAEEEVRRQQEFKDAVAAEVAKALESQSTQE